jgi:hypothetical protein
MIFDKEFCQREIVEIRKKYREIQARLGLSDTDMRRYYRLRVHTDLWESFKKMYEAHTYPDPSIRIAELQGLICDISPDVEGWLVVPICEQIF